MNILFWIKCSRIYKISTPPWLRRKMRLFRSKGCKFKPSRGTLNNGFGNLDNGEPDMITEMARQCMYVDVKGIIM